MNDQDTIAEEFIKYQLEIRDGKYSKEMYNWFLKHCNILDEFSYDYVSRLCENNEIGDTTVLVTTRELM